MICLTPCTTPGRSKVLSSGLRLGTVTGPSELIDRIALHIQVGSPPARAPPFVIETCNLPGHQPARQRRQPDDHAEAARALGPYVRATPRRAHWLDAPSPQLRRGAAEGLQEHLNSVAFFYMQRSGCSPSLGRRSAVCESRAGAQAGHFQSIGREAPQGPGARGAFARCVSKSSLRQRRQAEWTVPEAGMFVWFKALGHADTKALIEQKVPHSSAWVHGGGRQGGPTLCRAGPGGEGAPRAWTVVQVLRAHVC
jgi:hypothetical protein